MKDHLRTYMVNYYCDLKEDIITGRESWKDYCSEETEAESSALAIQLVMDYLVEQIYDCAKDTIYHKETDKTVIVLRFGEEMVECTVEQTEDEIFIRNLDGETIEHYYGFFVDSLIGKAMDDADLSIKEMSEQFEIPLRTLKLWVEGQPVSPDWAEGLILDKLESMKADQA